MAGNGSYRKSILELVLVTGIFAIASVFLLRLYMSANRLQERAVAVSSATICCQTLAEQIRIYGLEGALALYDAEQTEVGYVLCFDEEWEQNDGKNCYQMLVRVTGEAEGLRMAEIVAGEELRPEQEERSMKGVFCELQVAVYQR